MGVFILTSLVSANIRMLVKNDELILRIRDDCRRFDPPLFCLKTLCIQIICAGGLADEEPLLWRIA